MRGGLNSPALNSLYMQSDLAWDAGRELSERSGTFASDVKREPPRDRKGTVRNAADL